MRLLRPHVQDSAHERPGVVVERVDAGVRGRQGQVPGRQQHRGARGFGLDADLGLESAQQQTLQSRLQLVAAVLGGPGQRVGCRVHAVYEFEQARGVGGHATGEHILGLALDLRGPAAVALSLPPAAGHFRLPHPDRACTSRGRILVRRAVGAKPRGPDPDAAEADGRNAMRTARPAGFRTTSRCRSGPRCSASRSRSSVSP